MTLEKILRYFIIVGVFLLPFIVLIVVNDSFFPYIFWKNVVFRVIIEIIFSAWLLLAFLDKKYRPKWTFVLLSISIFVGITVFADIFGENFYKSFWSNFERMDGLITLLHLFAYMIVVQTVMVGERLWVWFWRISLSVSFIISIHVIFQSLLSDSTRLYSTLGNPIYLAVYALFHIFIALILFFRKDATTVERYLYIVSLPFLFYSVYLTSTRGATLGIFLGLLISIAGIAFSFRKNKKVFVASSISIVILITSVFSFWVMRDSSFVQNNQLLNRFASISLDDPSIFARTLIWKMAIEGIKEKPILGWGQENFNYVFNFNYNPKMYKLETWYDRTHNIVFDIAVTSGIFALIAYASIFLALFLLIYRTNNFQITQKWLLIGLLVAYGFQNLTVFDQVLSYILFYSIIAWIVAISDDVWSRRKKIENKEMDELSIWLIFLIVPVVAALIFLVNVRAIKANFDLINGLRLAQTADFLANNGDIYNANKKAVESLNRLINASNIKSYGTQEINEQIVQTAIKFSRDKWIKRNILEEWYITSVGAMEYEKNRAPKDARFPVFLAEVYSSFGQFGKEKNELELALSLSPNKQKIILSMANNALIQNNKKEALELSKKAYDLEKSNTMAELFYAISLIENKEMDEFSELANKIPRLGADDRILITLVKNEEYKVAEQLWEDYFTADFDLRAAFILGKVYNTAGYKEKAIDSIRRAMEIDPRTRVDGEKFIEFLRN